MHWNTNIVYNEILEHLMFRCFLQYYHIEYLQNKNPVLKMRKWVSVQTGSTGRGKKPCHWQLFLLFAYVLRDSLCPRHQRRFYRNGLDKLKKVFLGHILSESVTIYNYLINDQKLGMPTNVSGFSTGFQCIYLDLNS